MQRAMEPDKNEKSEKQSRLHTCHGEQKIKRTGPHFIDRLIEYKS